MVHSAIEPAGFINEPFYYTLYGFVRLPHHSYLLSYFSFVFSLKISSINKILCGSNIFFPD